MFIELTKVYERFMVQHTLVEKTCRLLINPREIESITETNNNGKIKCEITTIQGDQHKVTNAYDEIKELIKGYNGGGK
ncbi:hypothetical protein [Streptococcus lutetiensis]|uniref:hypothetical protein n=1 Tax=Streptococcus lutetiensis TaxID=150055 RepID=UPI00118079D4|nr:hypothetical protein [Streptococcus lutetiensis]